MRTVCRQAVEFILCLEGNDGCTKVDVQHLQAFIRSTGHNPPAVGAEGEGLDCLDVVLELANHPETVNVPYDDVPILLPATVGEFIVHQVTSAAAAPQHGEQGTQ